MRNTYHILVAELVLITFVSTTFLPSQILFAEDISGIRADTTQIVTDTISITSSTDLVATGSSMVSPVDSGTLDTSDLTDSGSTESG